MKEKAKRYNEEVEIRQQIKDEKRREKIDQLIQKQLTKEFGKWGGARRWEKICEDRIIAKKMA